MSEAFEVKTGLKQGDTLSPVSFNLALEKAIRKPAEGINWYTNRV